MPYHSEDVTAMGVLYCKCFRRQHLLLMIGFVVLLYLSLICIQDLWSPQQIPPRKQPLRVNYPLLDQKEFSTQNPKDDVDHRYWETEYHSRLERVHDICDKNEILAKKLHWTVTSNRHLGNITGCSTEVCPIIVAERKLLFCFIPKVASTYIKRFFLNVSDIPLRDAQRKNNSNLHIKANDALVRVSPVFFPPTNLTRFYKIMFVRHPFDRLVSAFRSKAEKPRSLMGYFYFKFWDPIMQELRPKGSNLDRITFREFVWYLTHTEESEYDMHWTPFWSRCDPCLVDYNFIGKLETAQRDFPYAFQQAGIEFDQKWFSDYPSTNRSLTLKYFVSIPEDTIRNLYTIYRLDFELFGYSVQEFLPGNVTVN